MRKLVYLLNLTLLLASLVKAKPHTNIIYILADDLGYGDLSILGQSHFETPHIDKLARKGMIFTDHYSGSTVCAPSRASLLTGLHTGHAPVRGNLEWQPEGQYPMPESTYIIPQMLKRAGYTSGIFGKWGLGAPETSSEPLSMGFDRFYGYNCQRIAHHYYPYFLWDNDQLEVLWDNFGMETGTYAPDLIHQEALDFIEANQDHAFFCYYAIIQPHAEMFAQEKYMKKYRGKFLPESSYIGTDSGPSFRKHAYGSQSEAHAAFAAMVNCIDDYVGDIVAKLEALGITEDTLIIFTSDNGPHMEAGHDPAYFNSNGPFNGVKRDLYEGGIRVPMIATWPSQIEAGSITSHISAFWDVFPTFAEISGQPIPENIDGLSFLPTLLGKDEQAEHDYLYWEFHEKKGRQAVRKGNWKGVRYNVSISPDSPIELYDLSADLGETKNLAEQYPEIAAELSNLMAKARSVHPDPNFNFPDRRYVPRNTLGNKK
jgi:arylsulfatase A-like enzyme